MGMEIDPEQLKMGIKAEKEHADTVTGNKKKKIRAIAKDHLKEIPDYYTRLKKMEKKAGVKESRYMDPIERLHDATVARIRKGAKEGKYWLLRSEADEERWQWALDQVIEDTMAASIGGFNKPMGGSKDDPAFGGRNRFNKEQLRFAVSGLLGKAKKKVSNLFGRKSVDPLDT